MFGDFVLQLARDKFHGLICTATSKMAVVAAVGATGRDFRELVRQTQNCFIRNLSFF